MINFFTHWKTSLAGLFSIATGFYIGIKSNDWVTASPFIITGLGLFTAKDFDKP